MSDVINSYFYICKCVDVKPNSEILRQLIGYNPKTNFSSKKHESDMYSQISLYLLDLNDDNNRYDNKNYFCSNESTIFNSNRLSNFSYSSSSLVSPGSLASPSSSSTNSGFYLKSPTPLSSTQVPSASTTANAISVTSPYLCTHLDASKTFLGTKGILALLLLVEHLKGVKSLILRNNGGINECSLKVLLRLIAVHPSLETIDLRGNEITIPALRSIWLALVNTQKSSCRRSRMLSNCVKGLLYQDNVSKDKKNLSSFIVNSNEIAVANSVVNDVNQSHRIYSKFGLSMSNVATTTMKIIKSQCEEFSSSSSNYKSYNNGLCTLLIDSFGATNLATTRDRITSSGEQSPTSIEKFEGDDAGTIDGEEKMSNRCSKLFKSKKNYTDWYRRLSTRLMQLRKQQALGFIHHTRPRLIFSYSVVNVAVAVVLDPFSIHRYVNLKKNKSMEEMMRIPHPKATRMARLAEKLFPILNLLSKDLRIEINPLFIWLPSSTTVSEINVAGEFKSAESGNLINSFLPIKNVTGERKVSFPFSLTDEDLIEQGFDKNPLNEDNSEQYVDDLETVCRKIDFCRDHRNYNLPWLILLLDNAITQAEFSLFPQTSSLQKKHSPENQTNNRGSSYTSSSEGEKMADAGQESTMSPSVNFLPREHLISPQLLVILENYIFDNPLIDFRNFTEDGYISRIVGDYSYLHSNIKAEKFSIIKTFNDLTELKKKGSEEEIKKANNVVIDAALGYCEGTNPAAMVRQLYPPPSLKDRLGGSRPPVYRCATSVGVYVRQPYWVLSAIAALAKSVSSATASLTEALKNKSSKTEAEGFKSVKQSDKRSSLPFSSSTDELEKEGEGGKNIDELDEIDFTEEDSGEDEVKTGSRNRLEVKSPQLLFGVDKSMISTNNTKEDTTFYTDEELAFHAFFQLLLQQVKQRQNDTQSVFLHEFYNNGVAFASANVLNGGSNASNQKVLISDEEGEEALMTAKIITHLYSSFKIVYGGDNENSDISTDGINDNITGEEIDSYIKEKQAKFYSPSSTINNTSTNVNTKSDLQGLLITKHTEFSINTAPSSAALFPSYTNSHLSSFFPRLCDISISTQLLPVGVQSIIADAVWEKEVGLPTGPGTVPTNNPYYLLEEEIASFVAATSGLRHYLDDPEILNRGKIKENLEKKRITWAELGVIHHASDIKHILAYCRFNPEDTCPYSYPFVYYGGSGSGKHFAISAVAALLLQEQQEQRLLFKYSPKSTKSFPRRIIVPFFVGIGGLPNTLIAFAYYLLHVLDAAVLYGTENSLSTVLEMPPLSGLEMLLLHLHNALNHFKTAHDNTSFVLLVTSFESFQPLSGIREGKGIPNSSTPAVTDRNSSVSKDALSFLLWLPTAFPLNVRVVIAVSTNSPILQALQCGRPLPQPYTRLLTVNNAPVYVGPNLPKIPFQHYAILDRIRRLLEDRDIIVAGLRNDPNDLNTKDSPPEEIYKGTGDNLEENLYMCGTEFDKNSRLSVHSAKDCEKEDNDLNTTKTFISPKPPSTAPALNSSRQNFDKDRKVISSKRIVNFSSFQPCDELSEGRDELKKPLPLIVSETVSAAHVILGKIASNFSQTSEPSLLQSFSDNESRSIILTKDEGEAYCWYSLLLICLLPLARIGKLGERRKYAANRASNVKTLLSSSLTFHKRIRKSLYLVYKPEKPSRRITDIQGNNENVTYKPSIPTSKDEAELSDYLSYDAIDPAFCTPEGVHRALRDNVPNNCDEVARLIIGLLENRLMKLNPPCSKPMKISSPNSTASGSLFTSSSGYTLPLGRPFYTYTQTQLPIISSRSIVVSTRNITENSQNNFFKSNEDSYKSTNANNIDDIDNASKNNNSIFSSSSGSQDSTFDHHILEHTYATTQALVMRDILLCLTVIPLNAADLVMIVEDILPRAFARQKPLLFFPPRLCRFLNAQNKNEQWCESAEKFFSNAIKDRFGTVLPILIDLEENGLVVFGGYRKLQSNSKGVLPAQSGVYISPTSNEIAPALLGSNSCKISLAGSPIKKAVLDFYSKQSDYTFNQIIERVKDVERKVRFSTTLEPSVDTNLPHLDSSDRTAISDYPPGADTSIKFSFAQSSQPNCVNINKPMVTFPTGELNDCHAAAITFHYLSILKLFTSSTALSACQNSIKVTQLDKIAMETEKRSLSCEAGDLSVFSYSNPGFESSNDFINKPKHRNHRADPVPRPPVCGGGSTLLTDAFPALSFLLLLSGNKERFESNFLNPIILDYHLNIYTTPEVYLSESNIMTSGGSMTTAQLLFPCLIEVMLSLIDYTDCFEEIGEPKATQHDDIFKKISSSQVSKLNCGNELGTLVHDISQSYDFVEILRKVEDFDLGIAIKLLLSSVWNNGFHDDISFLIDSNVCSSSPTPASGIRTSRHGRMLRAILSDICRFYQYNFFNVKKKEGGINNAFYILQESLLAPKDSLWHRRALRGISVSISNGIAKSITLKKKLAARKNNKIIYKKDSASESTMLSKQSNNVTLLDILPPPLLRFLVTPEMSLFYTPLQYPVLIPRNDVIIENVSSYVFSIKREYVLSDADSTIKQKLQELNYPSHLDPNRFPLPIKHCFVRTISYYNNSNINIDNLLTDEALPASEFVRDRSSDNHVLNILKTKRVASITTRNLVIIIDLDTGLELAHLNAPKIRTFSSNIANVEKSVEFNITILINKEDLALVIANDRIIIWGYRTTSMALYHSNSNYKTIMGYTASATSSILHPSAPLVVIFTCDYSEQMTNDTKDDDVHPTYDNVGSSLPAKKKNSSHVALLDYSTGAILSTFYSTDYAKMEHDELTPATVSTPLREALYINNPENNQGSVAIVESYNVVIYGSSRIEVVVSSNDSGRVEVINDISILNSPNFLNEDFRNEFKLRYRVIRDPEPPKVLQHPGIIISLVVSKNGRLLATACTDTAYIWSVKDSLLLHTCIACAEDESTLDVEGTLVKTRYSNLQHPIFISSLSFNPNGSMLLVSYVTGKIALFSTLSGGLSHVLHCCSMSYTREKFFSRRTYNTGNNQHRIDKNVSSSISNKGEKATLSPTVSNSFNNGFYCNALYTPDALRIVAVCGPILQQWDAISFDDLGAVFAHEGSLVTDISVQNDVVFTVCSEGKGKLWRFSHQWPNLRSILTTINGVNTYSIIINSIARQQKHLQKKWLLRSQKLMQKNALESQVNTFDNDKENDKTVFSSGESNSMGVLPMTNGATDKGRGEGSDVLGVEGPYNHLTGYGIRKGGSFTLNSFGETPPLVQSCLIKCVSKDIQALITAARITNDHGKLNNRTIITKTSMNSSSDTSSVNNVGISHTLITSRMKTHKDIIMLTLTGHPARLLTAWLWQGAHELEDEEDSTLPGVSVTRLRSTVNNEGDAKILENVVLSSCFGLSKEINKNNKSSFLKEGIAQNRQMSKGSKDDSRKNGGDIEVSFDVEDYKQELRHRRKLEQEQELFRKNHPEADYESYSKFKNDEKSLKVSVLGNNSNLFPVVDNLLSLSERRMGKLWTMRDISTFLIISASDPQCSDMILTIFHNSLIAIDTQQGHVLGHVILPTDVCNDDVDSTPPVNFNGARHNDKDSIIAPEATTKKNVTEDSSMWTLYYCHDTARITCVSVPTLTRSTRIIIYELKFIDSLNRNPYDEISGKTYTVQFNLLTILIGHKGKVYLAVYTIDKNKFSDSYEKNSQIDPDKCFSPNKASIRESQMMIYCPQLLNQRRSIEAINSDILLTVGEDQTVRAWAVKNNSMRSILHIDTGVITAAASFETTDSVSSNSLIIFDINGTATIVKFMRSKNNQVSGSRRLSRPFSSHSSYQSCDELLVIDKQIKDILGFSTSLSHFKDVSPVYIKQAINISAKGHRLPSSLPASSLKKSYPQSRILGERNSLNGAITTNIMENVELNGEKNHNKSDILKKNIIEEGSVEVEDLEGNSSSLITPSFNDNYLVLVTSDQRVLIYSLLRNKVVNQLAIAPRRLGNGMNLKIMMPPGEQHDDLFHKIRDITHIEFVSSSNIPELFADGVQSGALVASTTAGEALVYDIILPK